METGLERDRARDVERETETDTDTERDERWRKRETETHRHRETEPAFLHLTSRSGRSGKELRKKYGGRFTTLDSCSHKFMKRLLAVDKPLERGGKCASK